VAVCKGYDAALRKTAGTPPKLSDTTTVPASRTNSTGVKTSDWLTQTEMHLSDALKPKTGKAESNLTFRII